MDLTELSIADLVSLREYLRDKYSGSFTTYKLGKVDVIDASLPVPSERILQRIQAIEEEIERRLEDEPKEHSKEVLEAFECVKKLAKGGVEDE